MHSFPFAALAIALTLASGAGADVTASTFTGAALATTSPNAEGWAFKPKADLTVTELGVYGFGSAGLSAPHTVGLFNATTDALITSAVVPSGQSGALFDGSWFVSITPVTLTSGIEYYILADGFTSEHFLLDGGISYAPQITWLTKVSASGPAISSTPTFANDGLSGELGPNFRYAPEPASLVSVLLMTTAAMRRRPRRDPAPRS